MNLPARIQAAMTAAGVNQSELARRLGVRPQSVQQWLSGATEPRGQRMALLAQALGVTAAWLTFGDAGAGDLGDSEQEVVHIWRQLTAAQRQAVLAVMREMVRSRLSQSPTPTRTANDR